MHGSPITLNYNLFMQLHKARDGTVGCLHMYPHSYDTQVVQLHTMKMH